MALSREVRFALRAFGKSPLFTAIAILTLALGIGANTAMFSILSAVLLRPLPYPEADRLVFVRDIQPQLRDLPSSYPEFLDWKELDVFEDAGAYWRPSLSLTGEGAPELVDVCKLTPNLFSMLGIEPFLGRLLEEEDDLPGAAPVVVLSHELWERRFGSDESILGRTIRVNGEPQTVVGVLPPGVRNVTPTEIRRDSGNDLWLPLGLTVEGSPRGSHFLTVVGRLEPGASREQADAEVAAAAKAFQEDGRTDHGILLVSLRERIVGSSRGNVVLLMTAVGLVLLIACANVANLLLARASGRHREIAIRGALGASRPRLLMQMLIESLLLALAGGALGVVLASWGLRLFSLSPGAALLRTGTVSMNASVLLFSLGLTVLTALLFGIAPALLTSDVRLAESLKEGGRQLGSSRSRHAVGRSLVVAEVGLALVLLCGAGLLVESLRNLSNQELGFDPERLLTFRLSLPAATYDTFEKQVSFHDRVLERIDSLRGVEGAAIVTVLPVEGGWNSDFEVEGIEWPEGHSPLAETRSVSPDYFRVMRIPLVEGRGFSLADTTETASVVLVDQELVRLVFGAESPLGRRIHFAPSDEGYEIVGVVGNVQHWSLGSETRPAIYFPHHQLLNNSAMSVVVRTSGDPMSFVGAVRDQILAVDPDEPLSRIRTMEEVVDQNLARRGFSTTLLVVFAALALFLASLGLYGVVSQTVGERAQEFGLRLTLGARGRDILALVFLGGGKLVGFGIAIGLAGALALTRLLSSQLFGVTATDASVYAVVALVVGLTAALALYLPARRAARVDPIVSLRSS